MSQPQQWCLTGTSSVFVGTFPRTFLGLGALHGDSPPRGLLGRLFVGLSSDWSMWLSRTGHPRIMRKSSTSSETPKWMEDNDLNHPGSQSYPIGIGRYD